LSHKHHRETRGHWPQGYQPQGTSLLKGRWFPPIYGHMGGARKNFCRTNERTDRQLIYKVGLLPLIRTRCHPTLHCTLLHYTALHCTALHCTALHCTALHCTALHCTALHCTSSHPDKSGQKLTIMMIYPPLTGYCTALHHSLLHCTASQPTALHCTALQHTALHCTALIYPPLTGHRRPAHFSRPLSCRVSCKL
jgi:hypothetical protein